MVTDRPYLEEGQIRTFFETVHPDELHWHYDNEDRFVTATHNTDWQFQFDNKLPQPFEEGVGFFIPAGTYHRLIKGTGDLVLTIVR